MDTQKPASFVREYRRLQETILLQTNIINKQENKIIEQENKIKAAQQILYNQPYIQILNTRFELGDTSKGNHNVDARSTFIYCDLSFEFIIRKITAKRHDLNKLKQYILDDNPIEGVCEAKPFYIMNCFGDKCMRITCGEFSGEDGGITFDLKIKLNNKQNSLVFAEYIDELLKCIESMH